MEATKWLKPSVSVSRYTVTARVCRRNASERRASLEKDNAQADPTTLSGKADTAGRTSESRHQPLRRGSGDSMYTRKAYATREAPRRGRNDDQPEAREGQAGRSGVAEGFIVPPKLGNASGGKGPQFKTDAIRGEGPGRLGNL